MKVVYVLSDLKAFIAKIQETKVGKFSVNARDCSMQEHD